MKMETKTERPAFKQVTGDMPEFPSLTELREKDQGTDALTQELHQLMLEHGDGKRSNRRMRRGNHTGHSKHSRFINLNHETDETGEPILTKFHFTRVRPWVRVTKSRSRDKFAKASRKKNRGK
jgi:hypothetical protein